MAYAYEFKVFEGFPHSRTVQIPELTAENHKWWFEHVRFTLEILKLREHIEVPECPHQEGHEYHERWNSDRYEVWRMLAIPAWNFLNQAESHTGSLANMSNANIGGRDEARFFTDGACDTCALYQSLKSLFTSDENADGSNNGGSSGWRTPDEFKSTLDCRTQSTSIVDGQDTWKECADNADAVSERSGWTGTYQDGTYQDGRD